MGNNSSTKKGKELKKDPPDRTRKKPELSSKEAERKFYQSTLNHSNLCLFNLQVSRNPEPNPTANQKTIGTNAENICNSNPSFEETSKIVDAKGNAPSPPPSKTDPSKKNNSDANEFFIVSQIYTNLNNRNESIPLNISSKPTNRNESMPLNISMSPTNKNEKTSSSISTITINRNENITLKTSTNSINRNESIPSNISTKPNYRNESSPLNIPNNPNNGNESVPWNMFRDPTIRNESTPSNISKNPHNRNESVPLNIFRNPTNSNESVPLNISTKSTKRIESSPSNISKNPPNRNETMPSNISKNPPNRNESLPLNISTKPANRNESSPLNISKNPTSKNEGLPLNISTKPVNRNESSPLNISKNPPNRNESMPTNISKNPPKRNESVPLNISRNPTNTNDNINLNISTKPTNRNENTPLNLKTSNQVYDKVPTLSSTSATPISLNNIKKEASIPSAPIVSNSANTSANVPLANISPKIISDKASLSTLMPSNESNPKTIIPPSLPSTQTNTNLVNPKVNVPNQLPLTKSSGDSILPSNPSHSNINSTKNNISSPTTLNQSNAKSNIYSTSPSPMKNSNIPNSVTSNEVSPKKIVPPTVASNQVRSNLVNTPGSLPASKAITNHNVPSPVSSTQNNQNLVNTNQNVSSSTQNKPRAADSQNQEPIRRIEIITPVLPRPIIFIPLKPLPDPMFFIPIKPSLPIPSYYIPPIPLSTSIPAPRTNTIPTSQTPAPATNINTQPNPNPPIVPNPQTSANSAQRPPEIPVPTPSPYQIKLKYASKQEFYNIFKYLIELEEAEEAKPFYENELGLEFPGRIDYLDLIDYVSSYEDFEGTSVLTNLDNQLRISDNQRRVAVFYDYNFQINPNDLDYIVVQNTQGDILEAEVKIILDFCLFIFNDSVPLNTASFSISLQVRESFERIKEAMIQYLDHGVDPVINSIFLGQRTEARLDFNVEISDYTAFDLFRLNNSQIKAVQNALKYRVSIIQGPPGTGKTQTISSIVYHIDNLCRPKLKEDFYYDEEYGYDYYEEDPNNYIHKIYNYTSEISEYFKKTSKILICAASNSPVFDLRRKLIDKGIKVLQVLAKSKENEYANDPGTLKYQYNKKMREDTNLNELKKKMNDLKLRNPNSPEIFRLQKRINWQVWNNELSIVKDHDIICCTTRVLQNSIFREISFDFVIVDEATQCFEPDIVLCLLKDVKHLILVGDIHQLGPVIKSQRAKEFGFDVTTIERLQSLGVPLTFLDTQYRMQPFLSAFSNFNFYENRIKNGQVSPSIIKFPNVVRTHGFFYHIKSKEERKSKRSSYFNSVEADAVIKIVRYLKSKNIENKNIGIITFYGGQREYLRGLIKKNRLENLEIMSVDESQGREKEYIILSCVRSNDYKNVGFLDEYRRLNVAMTRVKNGLIVCGNANTFVRSQLWSRLVSYFQSNNAIFTGDLDDLRSYRVRLQDDEPYVVRRAFNYSK